MSQCIAFSIDVQTCVVLNIYVDGISYFHRVFWILHIDKAALSWSLSISLKQFRLKLSPCDRILTAVS